VTIVLVRVNEPLPPSPLPKGEVASAESAKRVRGYGLSIGSNPSPGSGFAGTDLSLRER
jgi:hypothetical protein